MGGNGLVQIIIRLNAFIIDHHFGDAHAPGEGVAQLELLARSVYVIHIGDVQNTHGSRPE